MASARISSASSAEPGLRRESTSAKLLPQLLGLLLPLLFREGRGSIARTLIASSASMRHPSRLREWSSGGREVFGVANHGQVLSFIIAAMAAMVSFAAGAVLRRCPAAPGALVALMQARLYHFEDYRRGISDGDPDTDLLDGQTGPGADKESDHLVVLESPSVVRNSQGGLPKQADKQHKEEREAKGAPVDETPCYREKENRRKESPYN